MEFGLIALIIGISALTYSSGLEIDVENSRYRNYSKILGYNLGEWKHLPPVKYVSVVRYISSDADSGESDSSDYQYKLILAVDDHKRVVKLTSLEKEKAIEEALKIGEKFDLKVYDCTSPEKKWIR